METSKIQIDLDGFDYRKLNKFIGEVSIMERLVSKQGNEVMELTWAYFHSMAGRLEGLGKGVSKNTIFIPITSEYHERIISTIKEYRPILYPLLSPQVIQEVELFLSYLEALTLETQY